MTYVYPVLSRRSQGLSIGINLNPNNACNWACLYCQVPELTRGSAPEVDIGQLTLELRALLSAHRSGDLAQQFELGELEAPIRDIAISGNGEPTSCPNFYAVTRAIGQIAEEFDLLGEIKFVVITNGSLMDRAETQRGLSHWGQLGGKPGSNWIGEPQRALISSIRRASRSIGFRKISRSASDCSPPGYRPAWSRLTGHPLQMKIGTAFCA